MFTQLTSFVIGEMIIHIFRDGLIRFSSYQLTGNMFSIKQVLSPPIKKMMFYLIELDQQRIQKRSLV